jgi:hypothetical protein
LTLQVGLPNISAAKLSPHEAVALGNWFIKNGL